MQKGYFNQHWIYLTYNAIKTLLHKHQIETTLISFHPYQPSSRYYRYYLVQFMAESSYQLIKDTDYIVEIAINYAIE